MAKKIKLKVRWDELLKAEPVSSYFSSLQDSLVHRLGDFFQEYRPGPRKVVKDSIWGIIPLSSAECMIIDSPVFQRLRRVRQLGLSYLVYPTAGYSRFEHSLGTLQAVQTVVSSIRQNAELDRTLDNVKSILDYTPLIRLAALLHDVGHGPFSHLSEKFVIDNDDASRKLVDYFNSEINKDYGLAEIRSALFCLSEPLKTFLDDKTIAGNLFGCPNSEAIASMILGIPPGDPKHYFAAQLVSSIYDVDKIDYMLREARSANISLPIDVNRYFAKMEVRRVLAKNLNSIFRQKVDIDGDSELYILGTTVSGAGCLDEVYLSRVWLYDRMYRHHKVRAAEKLLMKSFSNISASDAFGISYQRLFDLSDDEVYALATQAKQNDAASLAAKNKLESLRDRRLPVRCFCFAERFIEKSRPPAGKEEASETINTELTRKHAAIKRLLKKPDVLAEKIAQEGRSILKHLGKDGEINSDDIFICKPGVSPVPEISFHFLFEGNVVVDYMKSALFAPKQWAEAYAKRKDVGYIFCPRGLESVCSVACETVIYKGTGAEFNEDVWRTIKVGKDQVYELKRKLEEGGYYKGLRKLRPVPKELRSASVQDKLRELHIKYSAYSNDYLNRAGWSIQSALEMFLKQFPAELVEDMVEVLLSGQFFNYSTIGRLISDSIRKAIKEFETEEDVLLCPLGQMSKDSAPHITRYVEKIERTKVIAADQLPKFNDTSPIIFFDDLTSTGSQARDILASWMGIENKSDLHEERSFAFDKSVLLGRPVAFAYGLAREEGVRTITEFFQSQLGCKVTVKYKENVEQYFGILNEKPELKEFLRSVGVSLLESTKKVENPEKWTEEQIAECAVGYGNSAPVIVFAYNAPTITLTALWLDGGTFEDEEWLPLFPRKTKD